MSKIIKMNNIVDTNDLFNDVRQLIESSRGKVANYANSTLVMLYWNIGRRVSTEVLKNQRAEYGENIISNLSTQLSTQYGKGFTKSNLSRMMNFYKIFPEENIVATVSQQLTWSHFMLILPIKDDIKRDFYAQMSLIEKWVVRDLKEKIDSNLFERTVLSKKPEHVIKESIQKLKENSEMSTDLVFRDPYLLNFLGFKDSYSESDLETAILNQLEEFIQEFGSDFCFVARQKTMSTANTDRRLDLLFFHRRLRRLIAIELKLTKFEPSHKGQMEWYLSWLDKNERLPHEEKPLGIILCAEKDHEDVEYLEMDASGIHVAKYITELPPRNLLEKKVKIAMKIATEQIEKNKIDKK